MRASIASSVEVQRALSLRDGDIRALSYMLCRLAYLRYEGPEVAEAAERIFEQQQPDGSWPLYRDEPVGKKSLRTKPRSEGWTMIPMQTSIPLRGLSATGYATDPRAEAAYEWLLSKRLEDGAWPGDVKADHDLAPGKGVMRVPGYRALPRSPGCRSNTTGALACLSAHPDRRTSDAAHAALDHLLARETRDQWALGFEISRLLGFERASGTLTFYATFDLAFLLDLATRCGVSADDARVADLVEFLEGLRGPFGLWEHHAHPQLSRWLTFDLDASLRRLESGDWTGSDVRVRFSAYPKKKRRY